jgi:transposase
MAWLREAEPEFEAIEFVRRDDAIKMNASGTGTEEIARILDESPAQVNDWVNQYARQQTERQLMEYQRQLPTRFCAYKKCPNPQIRADAEITHVAGLFYHRECYGKFFAGL